MWQPDELWIAGTMLVKIYVPVKSLPGYDKPHLLTMYGDYGDMTLGDAYINSWTTTGLSAIRRIEYKNEDAREGYVLCNVPPRKGGKRISLTDFAKSTGDAEIVGLLSNSQLTK